MLARESRYWFGIDAAGEILLNRIDEEVDMAAENEGVNRTAARGRSWRRGGAEKRGRARRAASIDENG